MNNEQTGKAMVNPNEQNNSNEESLCSMMRDFYSRKMLSVVIIVWIWAIIFIAGAIYTAIQFFKADQTKYQIMYAALFVCCFIGVGLMKVFAWLMISKNNIKKEIKRLELVVTQLTETCKHK